MTREPAQRVARRGTFLRRLKTYTQPELLVVDERISPVDKQGADSLFQAISTIRTRSIIVTTNASSRLAPDLQRQTVDRASPTPRPITARFSSSRLSYPPRQQPISRHPSHRPARRTRAPLARRVRHRTCRIVSRPSPPTQGVLVRPHCIPLAWRARTARRHRAAERTALACRHRRELAACALDDRAGGLRHRVLLIASPHALRASRRRGIGTGRLAQPAEGWGGIMPGQCPGTSGRRLPGSWGRWRQPARNRQVSPRGLAHMLVVCPSSLTYSQMR